MNETSLYMKIRSTIVTTVRNWKPVVKSIDPMGNGYIVYLSHGATLGESLEVQKELLRDGLQIPEKLGNAAIYVTE